MSPISRRPSSRPLSPTVFCPRCARRGASRRKIARVADQGQIAPPVDLSLETRLTAAQPLRARPADVLALEIPSRPTADFR
jgi:hypothetical protein